MNSLSAWSWRPAHGPQGLVVFDLSAALVRTGTSDGFEAFPDAPHEVGDWVAQLPWAPGVQKAVKSLQAEGIEVGLVSSLRGPAARALGDWLGVEHVWVEAPTHGATARVATASAAAAKVHWVSELASSLGVPYWRTAAVGETASDLAMLEIVSLPFWIGEEPFPGTRGAVHLPRAGLADVARRLLGAWLPEVTRP